MTSSVAAIEIEELDFAYEGHEVLHDVNVRIDRGEMVSIVGPNGGGKTTLIKLMLGLLEPTRGTVRVCGHPPAQVRSIMGYVPQHAHFDARFPITVQDVVLMGRLGRCRLLGRFTRSDKAHATEALEVVGLADQASSGFSELSGGQRQRVLIARALAGDPEILLLDEPTSSLDIAVETQFHELLGRLSRTLTVVLVSHDIAFVSGGVGKVICVRRTVAVHPTTDLSGKLISELYGRDLRLIRHDHDCGFHREQETRNGKEGCE